MPHSPSHTGRSTRSNSNSSTGITLADIKALIEGSDILNSLKEGIDDVKTTLAELTKRVDMIDNRTTALEKKFSELEDDRESLLAEIEERGRRRPNLIISGIAERVDGTLEERKQWDKSHVEEIFKDLGELNNDHISHIFRIGNLNSKRPRLLRIVCSDIKTKSAVLLRAKTLRSMPQHENVYINPDMTPMQQEQNKRLREEFKCRRSQGEDIVIRRGKIVPKKNFQ